MNLDYFVFSDRVAGKFLAIQARCSFGMGSGTTRPSSLLFTRVQIANARPRRKPAATLVSMLTITRLRIINARSGTSGGAVRVEGGNLLVGTCKRIMYTCDAKLRHVVPRRTAVRSSSSAVNVRRLQLNTCHRLRCLPAFPERSVDKSACLCARIRVVGAQLPF